MQTSRRTGALASDPVATATAAVRRAEPTRSRS